MRLLFSLLAIASIIQVIFFIDWAYQARAVSPFLDVQSFSGSSFCCLAPTAAVTGGWVGGKVYGCVDQVSA